MPSAVHSRNTLTSRPWRGLKQNRHSSTGQELKTVLQNDNERIAAMLFGKENNGGEKEASKSLPRKHATSNPSSHQTVMHSHTQSKQPSEFPRKQAQLRKPAIVSRERKATASLSQRPTRRQRGNAPELKDEAYIRRTMRMPTPQEYPGTPQDGFKQPKVSIYNVANGLAECRSETTALYQDAYQCTAYYNSAMHNQVVVGEGRTKASCSLS